MPEKPVGLGDRYTEVIVDRDGGVVIEQHGFPGQSCQLDSRALEQALGLVTSRRPKPDVGGSYQTVG